MKFSLETVDDQHIAGIHVADMSDLKAVADHCASLRSVGATGSSDMKHVATIPAFIVQKYINDNGITYAEFMRDPKHADRMLSDPALQAFRVWEGRV
jgi:predicted lipoprotein